MTRPVILLAAWCDYATPRLATSPPRDVVGSAAGRCPPVAGRPRAGSPLRGGRGDAAAEVEGAGVSTRAIPRRRHLHRRARSWFGWRPVDRLGAWVREVGLLALGLVAVVTWVVSLCGTAVLVGGAS